MNWAKLLSEKRIRELLGGERSEPDSRTEFERDYGRAVFSTPVRRLQDKTQVFPLEEHDAVRTRLTHSLEVSSVARSLGRQVSLWLSEKEKLSPPQVHAIETIAATCGLIHDLGNPPFGHAGESAIQSWFFSRLRNKNEGESKNGNDSVFTGLGQPDKDGEYSSQFAYDFLKWEGNAQTLRLISKLQVLADEFGLNLTCATFSVACKYSARSHELNADHERSKPGFFASEEETVAKVAEETGMVLRSLVSRFLTSKARLKAPLLMALKRVSDKGLPAVLFGGSVRDVMLKGASAEPRDVDIVVQASLDELKELFKDILVRNTRFGGLHLNARGWRIDVWPLSQTWAFRELRVGSSDFESLTRTTFLNIEAVAVDVSSRPGGRKVRTLGFFEGIKTRTLDINLEENPFPELAAVRALITASTLNHGLSRRLAKYVSHYLKKTALEQFVSIQIAHYGWVRCDVEVMHRWAGVIQRQMATESVIRVPQPLQLSLWRDTKGRAATASTAVAPCPELALGPSPRA